jgi:hypothetical protein
VDGPQQKIDSKRNYSAKKKVSTTPSNLVAMPKFEWDENKNSKNKTKHKIGFEEAKTVFSDKDAIELEASRNGEYRIIRIGKTATRFILLVVYTMRGIVVRLISARQANRKERNLYIEQKIKNQKDESTDR